MNKLSLTSLYKLCIASVLLSLLYSKSVQAGQTSKQMQVTCIVQEICTITYLNKNNPIINCSDGNPYSVTEVDSNFNERILYNNEVKKTSNNDSTIITITF